MATLGVIMLSLGMASCSSPRFYQVFNTASNDATETNGAYVFENEEVKVTYDFWSAGGQMSFTVENKMNSAIYIDWNRSHLVHGGVSYEYWTDSQESTSLFESSSSGAMQTNMAMYTGLGSSAGTSVTKMNGRKSAVSTTVQFRMKPVVQVPPRSKVQFSRFQLITDGIYDCNFHWISPKETDRDERTYDRSTSPLVFRNYLTYSTDPNFTVSKVVDNEFYIRSVMFLSSDSYFGKSTSTKVCTVNGLEESTYIYPRPYKKGSAFYFRFSSSKP
jgi:hypothetical protein